MKLNHDRSRRAQSRSGLRFPALLLSSTLAVAAANPAAAWYDGMPFGPNFEGNAIDADSHEKAHGNNENAADAAGETNDGDSLKGNDDPLYGG